ncbi:proteasome subunit beta type-4 [Bombyx mandarina]|uniref:Proteasome subunit beta n=2 Tax=Bombyx TaxID=7090 RepID=A0A8R2ALR6_BOMMO|nr:proteasome subunit beta type-4 [Bombyx mori]XP_028028738.1 proteasome subunit beta type-4 [Bombyx mandarina]
MAFMGDTMNPTPLWQNGPSPGAFYNFPGNASTIAPSRHGVQDFTAHSASPITTTTTVIGVKFDKGCVIAGDTLGSYGSLARFRDCPRVMKVNDLILLGCGGDYADFQYLKDIIQQKIIDERCVGDGLQLKPRSLHCWLTRVLYNKRSKMDPLWNSYVVAGIQDGEPFLGAVDKLGTAYEDAVISNGLGAYMATPLLRDAVDKGPLDQETAIAVVRKSMEVLFYRDARAFQRYQLGVVTAEGIKITDEELKHDWSLAHMIQMK